MIASKHTRPENDIYFLGAKTIQYLDEFQSNEVEFFKLYELISVKEKMSVGLFTLILDWLFMLGVVEITKNGMLKKCF